MYNQDTANNSTGDFSSFSEVQQWMALKKVRALHLRAKKNTEKNLCSLLKQLVGVDAGRLASADMRTVRVLDFNGYSIRKILFQTLPGVYVPANLYVPSGDGPFPAVLNSHGHWEGGKAGEIVQQTAQLLVGAGYVVLCMDAWGAGERGTGHKHEYHGAHLGGALLSAGESLLALQLLDNLQGVNLLCSLDVVAQDKIASVGASGGGNQSMWISAIDPRVKASVLAVSVGTFSGYILESNCMCELLPEGLLHVEASEVIGAIAPRAVKIFSAKEEQIPAFEVGRMRAVVQGAADYFAAKNANENLGFEVFDTQHDFTPEMQRAMLTFLNEKLDIFMEKPNNDFVCLETEHLQVLGSLESRKLVVTTREFLADRKNAVNRSLLSLNQIKRLHHVNLLRGLLKIEHNLTVTGPSEHWRFPDGNAVRLNTNDGYTIPIEHNIRSNCKEITLVLSTEASQNLMVAPGLIHVDMLGFNRRRLPQLDEQEQGLPMFHTLMRSFLWVGEQLMGRWVAEIRALIRLLKEQFAPVSIRISAQRDLALAALFYSVLYDDLTALDLDASILNLDLPNVVENAKSSSMAVHVPGFLNWGGVPLLASLSRAELSFSNSVDIGGNKLQVAEINAFNEHVEALKHKIIE